MLHYTLSIYTNIKETTDSSTLIWRVTWFIFYSNNIAILDHKAYVYTWSILIVFPKTYRTPDTTYHTLHNWEKIMPNVNQKLWETIGGRNSPAWSSFWARCRKEHHGSMPPLTHFYCINSRFRSPAPGLLPIEISVSQALAQTVGGHIAYIISW